MIEFRTLGALDLHAADGRALHSLLAQPKRIALLAYLCVATPRGYHRRDTLLALFWPEANDAHARNSLRNALHMLRRTLGEDAILARGDQDVAVNPAVVGCDAAQFLDAIERPAPVDAIALYTGDLLPGFFIDEAPGFERWLERERTRLRELAARAAHDAASRLDAEGNGADAVRVARRAVELSDASEPELRNLLELLAARGDHATVLKTYEEFAHRLSSEYQSAPSAETRALVQRLRDAEGPRAERDNGVGNSLQPVPRSVGALPVAAAPAIVAPTTSWTVRRLHRAIGGVAVVVAAISIVAITRANHASKRPPAATRRQLTFTGNPIMSALSPDGNLLAYSTLVGDSEAVMLQDAAGGPSRTLVVVAFVNTIEWSPDGLRLLVGSDNRAVVLPRTGGPPHEVPIPPHFEVVVHAYWLPDGEHVSIHGNMSRRIVVVDLRTDDTLSIPVQPGYVLHEGAWSADGRTFAVATGDSIGYQLRVVDLHGQWRVVLRDTASLASPHWAPNDAALFYLRRTEQLWRVALDRSARRAAGPAVEVQGFLDVLANTGERPAFSLSPNGQRMTYTRGVRFANLWMLDGGRSSEHPRSVALTVGTAYLWSPVVSPDGRWIAFGQKVNDVGELFRLPLDGDAPTQITFGANASVGELAWSPDGKRIAFSGRRNRRRVLMITDVADGRVQASRATREPGGDLAWAPSPRIAYQTAGNRNILLLDPASGDERKLVASDTTGWFFAPRYSPDGTRLAVSLNQPGGDFGLSFFDLTDSSSRRTRGRILFMRDWSPDRRYVYAQGLREMYRVDARGNRAPEPMLTLPWRDPYCMPVGPARPAAFVCGAADYTSDVWAIDNVGGEAARSGEKVQSAERPR